MRVVAPVAVGCTLALAAMFAWSRWPGAVESGYVAWAGPAVQGLLTAVSSRVGFSLAEAIEVVAIGVLVVAVGWLIRAVWRGRGRRLAVLGRAAV
ncbi:MAG: hypothetical protein ABMB14_03355, partial [Myxococcota bacterium]